jgi:hypothetical protein
MAGAPLRQGGAGKSSVAEVLKGAVVVIIQTEDGKEITLASDGESLLIEKYLQVFVDYRENAEFPRVEIKKNGDVVYSRSIFVENIKPIVVRMF